MASTTEAVSYSKEDALSWLELLNSPELNHEPHEFYQEDVWLREYRLRNPQFSRAASALPKFAELLWADVNAPLCRLFHSTTFNLVQWTLEYLREVHPDLLSNRRRNIFLGLIDALCCGKISPLHISAAMGLPSLSRELISLGYKVSGQSHIGTPLYCALVGPKVLILGIRPEDWSDLAHFYNVNRRATVHILMDAGADCNYKFRFKDSSSSMSTMLPLAMWASLDSSDHTIFERMLTKNPEIDHTLVEMLTYTLQTSRARELASTIAHVLIHALDVTLKHTYHKRFKKAAAQEETMKALSDLISECNLNLYALQENVRLDFIADQDFPAFVRDVVTTESPFFVDRLAKDGRFDPDMRLPDPRLSDSSKADPSEADPCNERVLHAAVSADQLQVVDHLLRHGANLEVTDDKGRTPLMLVESLTMLANLVAVHGAKTTAVDSKQRNIWHYLAASNDSRLLRWLCNHDPCREQNLKAMSIYCTPTADALWYINRLAWEEKSDARTEPDAARLLLGLCKDASYIRHNTVSIANLAVEWGQEDLVDGLVNAGISFRDIDEESGRTALHYLNPSASPSLVTRLVDMCDGLPLLDKQGQTPAEAIVSNYRILTKSNGEMVPTRHPSSQMIHSHSVENLLTPKTAYEAVDIWARCCDIFRSYHPAPAPDKEFAFVYFNMRSATSALLRVGAVEWHERECGRSGVYLFSNRAQLLSNGDQSDEDINWDMTYTNVILKVLEASRGPIVQRFYQSEDSRKLLQAAHSSGPEAAGLVQFLSSRLGLDSSSEAGLSDA